MPREWSPDEGNDPGLPLTPPTRLPGTARVPKATPLRVLNPYSRFLASAAATAGAVWSLVDLEWRWSAIGLVLALGIALAGPWQVPS